MSNKFVTFVKTYAPEILTGVSVVGGVTAICFSYHESEKAKHRLHANKESLKQLSADHKDGIYNDSEYKKHLVKGVAKTAGNFAYDMKGTLISGGIMAGAGIASAILGHNRYKGVSALAATALGYAAFLEEGIRSTYGNEGLQEIKKQHVLHNKIEAVNKETGETETKEYDVAHDLGGLAVIDTKARDLCIKTGYPYGIGTILIDDRFSIHKRVNGDINNVLFNLRVALSEIQAKSVRDGKITILDELNCLGLFDSESDSINKSLADMIGTINVPYAHNYLTGSDVLVPGFDGTGKALNAYGEQMFKNISFGDEMDKVLFGHNPYEEIDEDRWFSYQRVTDPATNKAYFLLDLSYDGNIANIGVEKPDGERVSAFFANNPETER